MSSEALAWAIRCKVAKASLKNMLMVVSDLANHIDGRVFASLAYLQEVTGLSKRTVLDCLEELMKLGVLEQTEDRVGRTGQIPVYLFHMPDSIPRIPKYGTKKTGAETSPFQKGVQKRSETGAVLHGKGVQKRTTEPSNRNQEEEPTPSSNEEGPRGENLFGESLTVFHGSIRNVEPGDPVAKAFTDKTIEDFVVEHWHQLKADFPGVADVGVLNDARRKKIRARAAEVVRERKKTDGWVCTLEDVWTEIFQKIRASTFLTGRDPPGRGYSKPMKLTIDYVLRPSQFLQILDRDNDTATGNQSFDPSTGRRFGPAEAATRAALASLDALG